MVDTKMVSLFDSDAFATIPKKIALRMRLEVILPFLPDRLKYGADFNSTYSELKQTQYKSKEWHKKNQEKKLRALVHHAYEKVPYYHRMFKKLNINPSDIRTPSDLCKLPILTKSDLIKYSKNLIARNYPARQIHHMTSGGSTGVSSDLYIDKISTNEREWAFIRTMWDHNGYRESSKMVSLRCAYVNGEQHPFHFRFDWYNRTLVLSSFHLNDFHLSKYVEALRKFSPDYYHAYPSSMGILCRYVVQNQIELPKARGIMLSSEKPLKEDIELAESIFQCRAYTHYGQSERVVLAGECEQSRHYHVFPEYGVCEILSKTGDPIEDAGERGTIVGTGFINTLMPLLRFDTEDICSWLDFDCVCGRAYPLISEVEGRTSDSFVISSKDRLVPITALAINQTFFDKIRMFQYVQSKKGEIVLYLVPSMKFRKGDEELFVPFYEKRLGSDFNLHVNLVDDIEPTKSGKRNMLIQHLSIDY